MNQYLKKKTKVQHAHEKIRDNMHLSRLINKQHIKMIKNVQDSHEKKVKMTPRAVGIVCHD